MVETDENGRCCDLDGGSTHLCVLEAVRTNTPRRRVFPWHDDGCRVLLRSVDPWNRGNEAKADARTVLRSLWFWCVRERFIYYKNCYIRYAFPFGVGWQIPLRALRDNFLYRMFTPNQ